MAGWFVVLAVCFRITWTLARDAAVDPIGGHLRAGECRVSAVLDDGTLEVVQAAATGAANAGRPFRVRLLGVRPLRSDDLRPRGSAQQVEGARPEAPSENVELAAAAWLREATVGRSLLLTFDRRRFDQQGRWLVYAESDGTQWNVEWVRAGWARVDAAAGDASAARREIQRAEAEARRAGRGGWRRDAPELVPPRPRG